VPTASKKPDIEEKKPKSQTIFLTSTVSNKKQICEIWRQKIQSGNRGLVRRGLTNVSFLCDVRYATMDEFLW